FPTSFPTPDKADSIAKGTNIYPSQDVGFSATDLTTTASFHNPVSVFQLSLRSSCGLGYSGCGFAGSSCSPQVVKILSPAGFQSCACAANQLVVTKHANAKNRFIIVSILISRFIFQKCNIKKTKP